MNASNSPYRLAPWVTLRRHIAASCLAALVVGTSSAGPFEDGYAAYARGDYAAALKIFVPLAEGGNPDSEYSVGVMYAYGRGLPRGYADAAKWFRRAADKGQAGAQYDLGVLYAKGQGVPEDTGEAAKWYRKAADQGDVEAQNELGSLYGTGQGVPQDLIEAYRWFDLAATGDAGADFETHDNAVRNRETVAGKMTPAQIAEAQKLAKAWKSR